MDENNMQIVLDALAETIKKLRMDVQILKYENENLRGQIADYEKKVGNNND